MLASSKKIPIVNNACLEPLSSDRLKMPVVKGRVEVKTVDVLRDTGCSGIVVKNNLVSEDQFSGDFNVMLLIDNTVRKVLLQDLLLIHLISRGKWKRSVSQMPFTTL